MDARRSRQIRQGKTGESNKTIPILVVTANVIQEDIQGCFVVGIRDFNSRPIEFDRLSNKIPTWIGRGRSVIEKRVIENLKEMAATGNKSLIKELVLLFMQEATASIKKLREQVQNEDFVSVAKTAHYLKSSCANLGVFGMKDLTEKLELQKNGGNKDQSMALVDGLEKEYNSAIVELKKLM